MIPYIESGIPEFDELTRSDSGTGGSQKTHQL
jgi:hypothetical protein